MSRQRCVGDGRFVSNLQFLLMKRPRTAGNLFSELVAVEACGWPPDEAQPTMDEISRRPGNLG